MLRAVEGTFENGQVRLLESPPDVKRSKVIVTFLDEEETVPEELLHASESSLDFWNNPVDDQVWNNA